MLKKLSTPFHTLILFSFITISCSSSENPEAVGFNGWLSGTTNEKLNTVSNHLRGFDMAMAETGYRYVELYWAGVDENWEYAEYQVDKIKLAISNGFERRPLRKESGEHFMNNVLPEMKSAISKKDSSDFFRTFEIMTTNCNACHALENVSFFNIQIPETRQSPVKQ
jgi:hypothetical protein